MEKEVVRRARFTLIMTALAQKMKRCSHSLKVKEREGQLLAALLLPLPDQDWCGMFSLGYLPCYMFRIQLCVITVSTVQNPLAKSAIVKV